MLVQSSKSYTPSHPRLSEGEVNSDASYQQASASDNTNVRVSRKDTPDRGSQEELEKVNDDIGPNRLIRFETSNYHSGKHHDHQVTFSAFPSTPSRRSNTLWSKFKALLYPQSPKLQSSASYRALPILSAVFIPLSVLLSIPSITGRWYIRTENNETVQTRPNPMSLAFGMSFALMCSLLATICLIVRFMEKHVKKMTLLCIGFLSVSDVIYTVTVTAFGVVHRFDDGFTYGQPFWMTVCSTIVSLFANITLSCDYKMTRDFEKNGSGLTPKQRSLAVIIILVLCYIAIGSFIYTKMLDLSFIDALYLTVVSMETIGFGDLTPKNTTSRIFTCFYTSVGIISLALAVSLIREALVEAVEVRLHKRILAVRERQRELRIRTRWTEAVEMRLKASGQPVWVKDENLKEQPTRNQRRGMRLTRLVHRIWGKFCTSRSKQRPKASGSYTVDRSDRIPPGMRLNLEGLSEAHLRAAALEIGVPLEQFVPAGLRRNRSASRSRVSLEVTQPGVPFEHSSTVQSLDNNDSKPTGISLDRTATMVSSDRTTTGTAFERTLTGFSFDRTQTGMSLDRVHTGISFDRIPTGISFDRTPTGIIFDRTATLDRAPDSVTTLTHARVGRMVSLLGRSALAMVMGIADAEEELLSTKPAAVSASSADVDLEKNDPEFPDDDSELEEVEELQQIFEESVKLEERRSFYVHLAVAFGMFFTFWLSGSAIFMKTEKWPFATAMYFCFIAFSTLGYGDFAPKTPAGRSIFVVWALLGVGTMTILISVVGEAFSVRYKKLIHTESFDEAVKVYHETTVSETPAARGRQGRPASSDNLKQSYEEGGLSKRLTQRPANTLKSEASFPYQVLRYTKHMQTLLELEESSEDIPGQIVILNQLFDGMTGVETLRNRADYAGLANPETKRELLMLIKEKLLRDITVLSKDAVESVRVKH